MSNNKFFTITIFSVLLVLCLLFYLSATEKDRLARARDARIGDQIERGAQLYSNNCKNCHGSKGEGVGQLGPSLSDSHFFLKRKDEVGWNGTLQQYILAISEFGRMMGTRPMYAGNGSTAVMPPWHKDFGGPLRTDEINAITDYILNWEKSATGKIVLTKLAFPPSNPQAPQVVARGQQVFVDKCGSCHLYKAVTSPTIHGPDLTSMATLASTRKPAMEPTEYIKESILIPEEYITQGFESIALKNPCGAILTQSELMAVTSFILQRGDG